MLLQNPILLAIAAVMALTLLAGLWYLMVSRSRSRPQPADQLRVVTSRIWYVPNQKPRRPVRTRQIGGYEVVTTALATPGEERPQLQKCQVAILEEDGSDPDRTRRRLYKLRKESPSALLVLQARTDTPPAQVIALTDAVLPAYLPLQLGIGELHEAWRARMAPRVLAEVQLVLPSEPIFHAVASDPRTFVEGRFAPFATSRS